MGNTSHKGARVAVAGHGEHLEKALTLLLGQWGARRRQEAKARDARWSVEAVFEGHCAAKGCPEDHGFRIQKFVEQRAHGL